MTVVLRHGWLAAALLLCLSGCQLGNGWKSASIGSDPFLIAEEDSPHHAEEDEACGRTDVLLPESVDSDRVTARVPLPEQTSDQPAADEVESAVE